ncbi:hypothetical protein [Kingella oralis]|uniref:Uncharacterized protein n=1 Tax=Kingella oralis ATCC 51147 TaxID=629741 RepID=C4GJK6_9NEIS|nr:hypothetical protein [Kingella oralis]EEP67979.1 hypothetical protein GCWU000324_02230 [Kingella oralis ATCC 51147]QMT43240.1 hypothetical protein H3L93_02535 [Kingella oralis]
MYSKQRQPETLGLHGNRKSGYGSDTPCPVFRCAKVEGNLKRQLSRFQAASNANHKIQTHFQAASTQIVK